MTNRSNVRVNPLRFNWLLALPIAVKLLLGLVIVLLISGLLVNAVARSVIEDAQRELVFTDLESSSRSQAFRLVDLIGQEITVMNRFTDAEIVQRAAEQRLDVTPDEVVYDPVVDLQLTLAEFRAAREEFSTLALVNPNGVILGVDPVPSNVEELDYQDWLWFDSALADGEGSVYISSSEEDFLSGQSSSEDAIGVIIAIPVYRENAPDELIGVMFGLWNLSNVVPTIGTDATDEQISVLQLDGTILVAPPGGGSTGSRVGPAIRDNIQTQPSGNFSSRVAAGTEYLYGFTRLDDTGLADENPAVALRWVVVVREPASIVAEGAGLVLGRLQAALAATVFVSALVLFVLSRVITRPLNRLTETASQLAEGDLSVPIPDLPKDEVGQLADTMRLLVDRLLYRVRQLNAAVQVSRATAATFETTPMLRLVARSLTEQFSIPEVRIYLLGTDAQMARLEVGLGPESERLARSGYTVKLDAGTLPGRAMVNEDAQYTGGFEAPAFAGSSMEPAQLALPLKSGQDLYGVLHIIADRPGAFEQQDIDVLQLIADQVASSIKTARLFAQSQESLEEIETLNRRLTQDAWTEYLDDETSIRHTLDADENWPMAPDEEALVARRDVVNAITYREPDGRVVLAAPLLLRGEAIGILAVTRPPGSSFNRDEVALMESVTARMALIAEGIRLVEESNQRAAREQRISDVSAKLFQQTDSVETILRNALSELGGALGSEHVALRFGEPPSEGGGDVNIGRRVPDDEPHHETRSNGAHDEHKVNDNDND